MFRQLSLQQKLLVVAAPPLVVLAIIAVYAMVLGGGSADAAELTSDLRTLGAVALAAMLMSGLAVVLVARSISDAGEDITKVVDEFANQRLPLLLDGLRNPGTPSPTLDAVDLSGQGETVEKLAAALTTIQEAAVEVAGEQHTRMRRGLSELVINLARRNQSLLDRQIEFIDELESNEEDPDRLEELFGLDHLATRMRRNAESLLVVAGAEPPRRRGGPVSVSDILRVALSEIEDYRHVQLGAVDDSHIGAQSAIDVAHLMSELMENATQFSPPETAVEITGSALADGDYVIAVVDHGIGMTPDQIIDANEILARPPDLELGLSRSLGFMVIGRLARRLDITVELNPTSGGGTTALVLLRAALLNGGSAGGSGGDAQALTGGSGRQMKAAVESSTGSVAPPPPAPAPAPAPAPPAPAPAVASPAPIAAAKPATAKPAATQSDALAKLMGVPLGDSLPPESAGPPAKLEEAVPSGDRFDAGVNSLLNDKSTAAPAPGRTAAGLVKRDRSKSMAPASEGRTIPGGNQAATASGRSPEEIRDMLAKYRGGRGRPTGSAPKKKPDNESGGPA